jgi:hypothetical protein
LSITQFAQLAPPPIYGVRKLDGRRPDPPKPQPSLNLRGEDAEDGEAQPLAPDESQSPAET